MTTVYCPICTTNEVPFPTFAWGDTSVEVQVCGSCREQGLLSVKVRKSALVNVFLAVPVVSVHHQDGLVSFEGGLS